MTRSPATTSWESSIAAKGTTSAPSARGLSPTSSPATSSDLCPVGCLTSKPFRFKARVWELSQTQSTSIWDASGAKVTHWTRNGKLYRTTPPSRKTLGAYTVNEDTEEFIDNITRFGSDFGFHEDRWDESRVIIGSTLLPAAFTEAIRRAATGLAKVKLASGPDSIGVLVSPRATMEEGYLAGKFARTVIGTDNVDWRMSFQTEAAATAASVAFDHADGDLEGGFDAAVFVNGDYLHSVPVFASRIKEYARINNKPVVLIGHHHDAYLAPHSSLRFHCAPGATAEALQLLAKAVAGDGSAKDELASLFAVNGERVEALVSVLKSSYKKALIVQSLEDMNGAYLPQEVPSAISLKQALGEAWKYIPTIRDRNAFGLRAVGAEPGRLPAASAQTRKAWKLDDKKALPLSGGVSARGHRGRHRGRFVEGARGLRRGHALCLPRPAPPSQGARQAGFPHHFRPVPVRPHQEGGRLPGRRLQPGARRHPLRPRGEPGPACRVRGAARRRPPPTGRP
jgi:NADH-quinone oxidoreductase subunit G